MIVCSCNVLTDKQILETLQSEAPGAPRSPAQAYRCLGCSPECGRCLVTVRRLLQAARVDACDIGCPGCPGAVEHAAHAPAADNVVPFDSGPHVAPRNEEPAEAPALPLIAAE
ncbi:bacterioferritin-associated ferredoxin [Chelatococcus caeni]|uniref:Bacterioferritin-associated ferredoxin n=1 Tax=Chelatococcus caeni TaxID=1348468 RepID=A0A840C5R4_9HYPH|nr:(2Fe-2S)-binding protein [Chelatococcus caeni]MBB4019342.1 bacterioferritin-associated ferredoxin [Chelatococcus caeni]